MKQFDFELPEFTRFAWVSDIAMDVWQPKIEKIIKARRDIEWLTVAEGIRPCAAISISGDYLVNLGERVLNKNLVILPLGFQGVQNYSYSNESIDVNDSKEDCLLNVIVGARRDVLDFKAAFSETIDPDVVCELLGYPSCCRKFFKQILEENLTDTTWPMVATSVDHSGHNNNSIEVICEPHMNIFCRNLGIRVISHPPCNINCKDSLEIGRKFIDVGRKYGYSEEMDWLLEILSWPLQWSSMYGIADIKNPILTIITKTDYTHMKHTLKCLSDIYPEEAVQGTGFPYHVALSKKPTKSKVHHRGFDFVAKTTHIPPNQKTKPFYIEEWYYTDNGFRSRHAMNEAHNPVKEFAIATLSDRPANVLDLGCGNGALLRKICEACPNITAFGIDVEADRIEHARKLLPEFRDNFIFGDFYDVCSWMLNNVHYSLMISALCRFEELDPEQLVVFGKHIEEVSDNLLVYDYWGRNLEEVAQSLGIHLLAPALNARAALAKFGTKQEILSAQRLPLPWSSTARR